MGEVFLAHDTLLDRPVAIKILPSDFVNDHDRMRRFVKEAKAASAISHPNVAHIYEIGENDGIHFIAMEYIQGETLAIRMKRQPLKSEEIIDLGIQAADALQEAHTKGIVHRDIKPTNMIIASRGQVKLVDFGLAKFNPDEASISSRVSTASQTELGTIIGTLPYMSPEQVLGKSVDHRTDFFSLGIVLYELANGKLPFTGNSAVELADSIIHKTPDSLTGLKNQGLTKIIMKLLEKEPDDRYQRAEEIVADLQNLHGAKAPASFLDTIRRPFVAIPIFLLLAGIVAAGFWVYQRNSKIRWAREDALLQIPRLVDEGKFDEAVALGFEAEKYIPNDPVLKTFWDSMAITLSITTDPPGADIFLKGYNSPDANWKNVGTTPIDKLRVPRGYFRAKIEKSGFQTVYGVAPRAYFQRKLFLSYPLKEYNNLPTDMVSVPGVRSGQDVRIGSGGAETFPIPDNYLMDVYEVSNKDFKKFVDSGGYQNQKYWKYPFIKDSKEISFEEAMKSFHDETGRPGPLQWEVGGYPQGEDDLPVSGVSWYEASAYAEFVGKSLPTIHHWYHASGGPMNEQIIVNSNFNGRGPKNVRDQRSMSPFGTYNMAGNVKEWSSTETVGGKRFILGGSYLEPVYLFMEPDQRSPFDREKNFGFRCVKYLSKLPASLVASFDTYYRDYSKEKPVSDDVFAVLKTFYSYERKDLNSKLESNEVKGYVRKEKISIDTAYGNERMTIFLFLPANSKPPYETIVFFPGAGAQYNSSSANIEEQGYADHLDVLVRSGRAVGYPVYKGTFERGGGPQNSEMTEDQLREWKLQTVKDVSRTLDYLESRSDINKDKFAYYGTSWGGRVGSFVGAVEDRFKTLILLHGGFPNAKRSPENDEINFAPHVHIPVLMINGKYDHVFPVETSQNPMFRLLGTPAKDKAHLIFEGGHSAPRKDVVKAVLDWLDRYLGPVS